MQWENGVKVRGGWRDGQSHQRGLSRTGRRGCPWNGILGGEVGEQGPDARRWNESWSGGRLKVAPRGYAWTSGCGLLERPSRCWVRESGLDRGRQRGSGQMHSPLTCTLKGSGAGWSRDWSAQTSKQHLKRRNKISLHSVPVIAAGLMAKERVAGRELVKRQKSGVVGTGPSLSRTLPVPVFQNVPQTMLPSCPETALHPLVGLPEAARCPASHMAPEGTEMWVRAGPPPRTF